ncbi:hypothetical protein BR93DRAFT_324001 [Coniochaeta sp. PMI_546]|nr:hypothetical protein BR93DRAFT_324001 [Coniochaeta sp. PMI_546]
MVSQTNPSSNCSALSTAEMRHPVQSRVAYVVPLIAVAQPTRLGSFIGVHFPPPGLQVYHRSRRHSRRIIDATTSFKVGSIREPTELFLHRLRKNCPVLAYSSYKPNPEIIKKLTRLHRRKHRRNARKFRVEVARVRRALDARQERRLHALVVDVVPVDVPEERLAHDLLRVRRPAAQPLVRLARQQLLQDGHAVARHRDGVQRFVGQDGVVDLVLVLAAEGRLLQEHLVDQYAEGPPVHCAAVFLVKEDLGVG